MVLNCQGKICHEEWDFGKKLNDTDLHHELTGETKRNADGVELYRIRTSRDIPERGVKSGTIGGWVSSTHVSSGKPRIGKKAWVGGHALRLLNSCLARV